MPDRRAVVIPHAPPLRFARQVREADGTCVIEALVAPGCPADAEGTIPAAWLVEVAAQAAAAWRGDRDGTVGEGRLVGLADWRHLAPGRVGETLAVTVRHAGGFGPLAAFAVRIAQHDRELATGRLQVHLAE